VPSPQISGHMHYGCQMMQSMSKPNLKFKDAQTSIESFTGTKVASNPKHWHLFRCSAYVLVQDLQVDTAINHKWKLCLQVGMYPGCLPQHAQGCLPGAQFGNGTNFPQFHIKLDSNFQTLREKGAWIPTSTWQIKCSFMQQPTKVSHQDPVPWAGRTTGALPMQWLEGAQPATNDEPQPDPESFKTKTWNHRNFLCCTDLGISTDQSIN